MRARAVKFPRLRLIQWVALAFMIALATMGGASRADEFAQVGVRLSSIVVLAFVIVAPSHQLWSRATIPGLVCVGSAAALVLVQMIPLPFGVWTAMPGRALDRQIAELIGRPDLWRPWTLSPDRTLNALFSLIVPLSMLVLLGRMTQGQRFKLLPWVLAAIFASAMLMIFQMANGNELSVYVRSPSAPAAGFFANRNHEALLLAMGLPLTASWATEPGSSAISPRIRVWLALAGTAFLVVMIPATGSRAGLFLGAGGLLGAIWIAWTPAKRGFAQLRRSQRRRVSLAALAAGIAVVFAAFGFSRAVGLQRLLSLDVLADARSRLFPRVMEAMTSFFPFGSGYGSFDPVFRRFERLQDLSTNYYNQAHNDYLQIVLEGGLAGGAALAAVLIFLTVRFVRIWRETPDRTANRYARLATILIVLMLMASAVDYPMRTPIMMALLALFSVWLSERPSERTEQQEPLRATGTFTPPHELPIGAARGTTARIPI